MNYVDVQPPTNSETKDIDSEDMNYHIDLSKEVQHVMSRVSDWEIDDYVAVQYESLWYPGKIISMDDDMFKVSCLEYVDKFTHVNITQPIT